MEVIIPILEQVESVGNKNLEQQEQRKRSYRSIECPEEAKDFLLSMTIYKQIEREKRKKILKQIEGIEKKYGVLSDSQTAGKMLDELLEIVNLAHKDKIMFGMPYGLVYGVLSDDEEKKRAAKEISLIGYLIKNLNFIKKQNLNLEENEKGKLDSLASKISNLISTGTDVSKEILSVYSKDMLTDQLEKRDIYLSKLEQVVRSSVENSKEGDIIVERDNAFYCIKCPEESVITPAKFMNSPEFKDLEYGALRMGEGDNIIRLHNGQYHDMKGRVKMTFNVGDEKLEMTLLSQKAHEPENNALNFGKIMVHMDGENCKLFLKHYETLKGKSRTEKIIGRAKSFVEEKNGKQNEQFSVLEEVSISKCSHFNCQRQG